MVGMKLPFVVTRFVYVDDVVVVDATVDAIWLVLVCVPVIEVENEVVLMVVEIVLV